MAVLQSTNVQGTLCVNGVAVGGGKDFKYCCFTASSTFTPSQDLVDGDGAVDTTLVGGGGAGGFASISTQNGYNQATFGFNVQTGAGGGAGMSHNISKISATDACTVTVGAGGEMAAVGQLGNSDFCFINTSFSITDGTGGDTSFGDYTEFGGGAGCGRRLFCILGVTPQCGQAINSALTRNGGALDWEATTGGGAEYKPDNAIIGPDNGFAFTECFGFSSKYAAGIVGATQTVIEYGLGGEWTTNQTTSSQYNFSPKHCRGRWARTQFSCYCTPGLWFQNNGCQLDGGCRIGTNKHSLWENGCYIACKSCTGATCAANIGNVCFCESGSNAINCGGGGGSACLCAAWPGYCGGRTIANFELPGGAGGDGLVILKWFE